MRSFLFPIAAALLALACGDSGTSDRGSDPAARAAGEVGQQLQQGTEAARDTAGSAGSALERARDVAAPAARDLAAGVGSAEAQTCLALVSEQRYADAVGVCTAALQRDPDSEPLGAALETAREGAAAAMGDAVDAARDDAGARMGGAIDAARDGAAGQLDRALGTPPPAPGQ